MAQGFFKHIPNIQYDFKSDGKFYRAKDLFRKVSTWSYLQDGITGYSYYRITEGERPDVVASRLYGDSTLYWLFFLVNENLQDFNDWPKSNQLFLKFMDRKYPGTCLTASNSTDIVSYDHLLDADKQLTSRKFNLGEKVSQSSSVYGFVTDVNPTHNRITLNSVIGTFTANSRVLGPLPTKTFASLEGSGSTTVLESAKTQSTGTILEIYWDNVLQDENSYSIVLTPNDIVETTITFNTAPAAGVIVKVFERKSFVLSSVINEQDAAHHYTTTLPTADITYELDTEPYQAADSEVDYPQTRGGVVYESSLDDPLWPDGSVKYVETTGAEIVSHTFKTTVSTGNTAVTNLDYERELNEDKHLIRYIEPRYVSKVTKEFVELVRD